jgi:hypothetical protein
MNFKNNSILLCVLLIFSSCIRDSKIVKVESFKEIKKVFFQPVVNIKQLNPGKICFFDSLMVVTDWAENPRIHIYNRKNYKYMGNYGVVGHGPEEFNSPECLSQQEENGNMYLYDLGMSSIYNIDLKEVLNKKSFKKTIINKLNFPQKLFISDNIYISDNTIRGDNLDPSAENCYYIYDINKKETQWRGNKLEIDYLRKVNKNDRKNTAKTFMAYSKEKKKIIACYLLFNRIDIMNFDFEIEKQIVFGNKELEPFSEVPYDKKNSHFFEQPVVLDKSFLVPYNGNNSKTGEIHQYDYNGNPLRKFITEKPLHSLFYDAKYKIVYGIINDEKYSVVIIKINDNDL